MPQFTPTWGGLAGSTYFTWHTIGASYGTLGDVTYHLQPGSRPALVEVVSTTQYQHLVDVMM